MDREAWWAIDHGVEKSWTWLSYWAHVQNTTYSCGCTWEIKGLDADGSLSWSVRTPRDFLILLWAFSKVSTFLQQACIVCVNFKIKPCSATGCLVCCWWFAPNEVCNNGVCEIFILSVVGPQLATQGSCGPKWRKRSSLDGWVNETAIPPFHMGTFVHLRRVCLPSSWLVTGVPSFCLCLSNWTLNLLSYL